MNQTVKNYVNSIIALMPEVEPWQLSGIKNALEELYSIAYQEGEMKGIIKGLTNEKLFDHYED